MDTPLASHATPAAAHHQALSASTKVWLDETFPFDAHVRVEWQTEHGPASSVAKVTVEMRRSRVYAVSLRWVLDTPPDDVIDIVREVIAEGASHSCFADYETSSQMYGAVDGETTDRYVAWNTAMEAAYAAAKAVR